MGKRKASDSLTDNDHNDHNDDNHMISDSQSSLGTELGSEGDIDSANEDNEDNEDNHLSDDKQVISGHNEGQDQTQTHTRNSNSKRLKGKGLTVEEVNNLSKIETPFDWSLLRLQLNEMLSEVRLKPKLMTRIDEWIAKFECLLRSLKSSKSYDLTDQLWCKSVKVPLIQEPFAVNGKFCFEAPKVCKVIGSYGLGTAIGPQTVVDMAIEMPHKCWQRHDNLNHKYIRKRALYLAHICQNIKSNELIDEIKWTYVSGNHTKPILQIAPKGKLSKHVRLALTVCPQLDEKVFRWTRFTPEKNNIRSDWLQKTDCPDLPTPTYNSVIQSDLNLISNYEYLSKTVENCLPLKDSLILLEIWLKQRHMKSEFGFILSLFVGHLVENDTISRNSSCYHIFRNTLQSIANSRWDSDGAALNGPVWQPLDHYLTYFPVVLIDVSGYHNLCWNVSIDSYDRLRHESRLTVNSLDANANNSFESTFLKDMTFESKYDFVIQISVPSLLKCSKVSEISNDIIDNCGDIVSAFVAHLVPLCRRTVGKRVVLLEHQSKAYNSDSIEWAMDELPPHPNDRNWLTFGFLMDAEYAYNNIERGPAADSAEALEFKEFWGQKSELRRFQDNSICEAVYWDSKSLAQKRRIISGSIEYILTNILNIPIDSIYSTISLLDPMVELKNLKFEDKNIVYGTGEEIAITISHKLDALAKKLRSLEGLPLTITTVQGIDPVFRGTEVFPPLAQNSGKTKNCVNDCNIFDVSTEQRVPKYFKPLEVIIELEGSGKWPSDLDAFYRVKTSFHLELSRKLSTQFGLLSYANTQCVDVFEDGFVFRLMIGSNKELLLLRQMKTSEGLVKQISSEVADRLEMKAVVTPKISSALSGLSRTHLCYGITSRLAKRWISSQMLSFYLDDMAIDLMVAYLYLNPTPYTVPNSPIIGFLRFLSLICDHNWKISPLIVNLNDELNDQMLAQINAKFTTERLKYPPMFITSGYDKQLSKWTDSWPDSVILNRMLVLANAARHSLLAQIKNPIKSDPKLIFRPDLDIYDLILRLKSDQLTNQMQSIDFPDKYELLVKDWDSKRNERMPVIGFDPIQRLLRDLRRCYSQFGLFFYDQFGGRQIGFLWKPSVFESKAFTTSAVNGVLMSSTADTKGVENVLTNIEAIIEDFSALGDGIVTAVEAQTHNWPTAHH